MPSENIDIEDAKALIDSQDSIIVDIRDIASWSSGHIENAIHIDNSNVQSFIEGADKLRPLIVCCYHGNMSKGAADFFSNQGFRQSYSLNGGYTEWAKQV